MAPDPKHVARSQKLHEMRDKEQDKYRKAAIQRKIHALPPEVHAAAKAQSHSAPKAAATHAAAAQVEMTMDYAEHAPELSSDKHAFGRLPQKMGGTRLGWPLNEEAKSLLKKVKAVEEKAATVGQTVDFLKYMEEFKLPQALELAQQASAELTKKSGSDTQLADAIESYSTLGSSLEPAVERVSAAHEALLGAASGLELAQAEKQERADKAGVEQAQADLQDIQKKAEALKGELSTVVDYTEKLITDPSSYKDILKDAAQYLKGKAIDAALDYIVGDVYSQELKAAEAALEDAKKKLKDTQANIDLQRVEKATHELRAASDTFEAAVGDLRTAIKSMEGAEHKVGKKLGVLGGNWAVVAQAIEGRSETVENSKKGLVWAAQYQEMCSAIRHDAELLARNYNDYWTTLHQERVRLQEEDVLASDEAKARAAVQGIAEHNETVAKEIQTHADEGLKNAAEAEAYFQSESFLRPYPEIEAALHQAVLDG